MARTIKRPRLIDRNERNKKAKQRELSEKDEDFGMETYYSHIDKKQWRPLHLDIEKDVRRSNCENLLKIPYDDTRTIVIFPEEYDRSVALVQYEETNPADIVERLVVWWNTEMRYVFEIVFNSTIYRDV